MNDDFQADACVRGRGKQSDARVSVMAARQRLQACAERGAAFRGVRTWLVLPSYLLFYRAAACSRFSPLLYALLARHWPDRSLQYHNASWRNS